MLVRANLKLWLGFQDENEKNVKLIKITTFFIISQIYHLFWDSDIPIRIPVQVSNSSFR